ncbi:MAG TPA: hypothetical protein VK530_03035 [Candidatus Acidoferrum sp.]|nr:hypothetical protein [Candidatus Acidoferrum sp.]
MNTDQIYVLEYSASQGGFHIQTMRAATTRNMKMFLDNRMNDYQIIGCANSHEEASKLCDVVDCRADRSQPFSNAERETMQVRSAEFRDWLHQRSSLHTPTSTGVRA